MLTRKACLFFICSILIVIVLFLWIDKSISERIIDISSVPPIQVDELNGTMKMVRPGGMMTIYRTGRVPSSVPSGSKVECVRGAIYLSLGVVKTRVRKEGICWIWRDEKTGTAYLIMDKKSKGDVDILVEDSFIKLEPDAKVKIEIDELGRSVKFTIINGNVRAVYQGRVRRLTQGATLILILGKELSVEFIPPPELEMLEEVSPYIPQ